MTVGFFAASLLLGCAGAPPPPPLAAPAPPPVADAEIEVVAALVALADERRYDPDLIGGAAAAVQPWIRRQALLAAGGIGANGSRSVVRGLLADEDTMVAATAAFLAGQLRDTSAVPALAAMLNSIVPDRITPAIEAAGALGKIGVPTAREALGSFLASADTGSVIHGPVVAEALVAAARAALPSVEPLERWATSADPVIRWSAAYALSRSSVPATVNTLRPLLTDPDPSIRAVALRGVAAPRVEQAGGSTDEVLLEIIDVLAGDSIYSPRIEAIRVLGTYRDPRAVSILEDRLGSASSHEILAAVDALGRLGVAASGALPALRALLDDPGRPSPIRAAAAFSIATIATGQALPILEPYSVDAHWRVRAAIAEALGSLETEALPTLRSLVRDPDPRVAARAVAAVARFTDVADHELIRPILIESLASPDTQTRAAALEGLGALDDPATFPALLDAYARAQRDIQNDAALAAIDAIGGLRGASVVPERAFFARFTRHPDPLVRQRAVERFGDAAREAWGDPWPIQTGTTPLRYREVVERGVAPNAAPPPRIRLETDAGTIDLELFAREAPLTSANFLLLAQTGYFDAQEWPRVVPNFVAQGGDPRGDTSGGPGYSIRDELNRRRFGAGVVGMALAGPDTGGSQFFITHAPQPHLDGAYTVFGRVVAGLDVIERVLPGELIHSVREIAPDG